MIARGWAAVSEGRSDAAVGFTDELLKADPTDHAAVELKIEALAAAPLRALDTYEKWLGGGPEDVSLLGAVAAATLHEIARGDDRSLQMDALAALAGNRDASAAARLAAIRQSGDGLTALLLARAGDPDAARQLLRDSGSIPPAALAEALPAAGEAALPRLVELLENPAPPVRAAAALALGRVGSPQAIPSLRALLAKEPMSRPYAAVALAKLGDEAGLQIARELLASDVPDIRLLGAVAFEGGTDGPWVDALVPLLDDPNGLTRIRAAELISRVRPDSAAATLAGAAGDPNPVVRADVARAMKESGLLEPHRTEEHLPLLRQLLRDPDPAVRLPAAASILRAGARR